MKLGVCGPPSLTHAAYVCFSVDQNPFRVRKGPLPGQQVQVYLRFDSLPQLSETPVVAAGNGGEQVGGSRVSYESPQSLLSHNHTANPVASYMHTREGEKHGRENWRALR
jgi:hypothetical protein